MSPLLSSLSSGARSVLSTYYLSLRRSCSDTTPITTRQLEALIRLSEARAKAELQEVVTAQHATDVIDMMRESRGMEDESEHLISSMHQTSSRGAMSKSALKKKFIGLLRRKAEVKMEPIFTASELYEIHELAHMKHHIEDFNLFIEQLNAENYLLVSKHTTRHPHPRETRYALHIIARIALDFTVLMLFPLFASFLTVCILSASRS